ARPIGERPEDVAAKLMGHGAAEPADGIKCLGFDIRFMMGQDGGSSSIARSCHPSPRFSPSALLPPVRQCAECRSIAAVSRRAAWTATGPTALWNELRNWPERHPASREAAY